METLSTRVFPSLHFPKNLSSSALARKKIRNKTKNPTSTYAIHISEWIDGTMERQRLAIATILLAVVSIDKSRKPRPIDRPTGCCRQPGPFINLPFSVCLPQARTYTFVAGWGNGGWVGGAIFWVLWARWLRATKRERETGDSMRWVEESRHDTETDGRGGRPISRRENRKMIHCSPLIPVWWDIFWLDFVEWRWWNSMKAPSTSSDAH